MPPLRLGGGVGVGPVRTLWVGRSEAALGAQRPGGPACPAGVPISPEKWGERGPGASPLDPQLYSPLAAARSFWGSLSVIRQRGCFLRYAKPDLGRIFPEKNMLKKHFCERKSPNQGTHIGTVIAYRPEQCATTAKTSECQRAGPKKGGAGGHPPRLFASGLSLEKAWIPAPDRGGGPRGRVQPAPDPTVRPADTGQPPAPPGAATPPPG